MPKSTHEFSGRMPGYIGHELTDRTDAPVAVPLQQSQKDVHQNLNSKNDAEARISTTSNANLPSNDSVEIYASP